MTSVDPAATARMTRTVPIHGGRVADAVARTLHAAGVRHAFGMPGGEVVTLVDALEAAGIRFVLTRTETAGAIAAAATSLVTGAPGLLVTTLGPGLAAAVNGIADAAQERMPLVVLSGVVDRGVRATYTHQVLDHAALTRAAGAKASFEVAAASAAAAVVRAVRLALAPPFGPVHLDLSPDVAAAPAADAVPARMPRLASGVAPAAVLDLFARAQRPLVVAGFEAARNAAAAAAVTDLAVRHGVPVITTYKAKGLLDETLPQALGAAGLSPRADAVLLPLVRAADLILAVGYDPIEMRQNWRDPFAAPVVALTEAPADHGMFRPDLTIVGPLATVLGALAALPPAPRWSGGEPAAARARLDALFAPPAPWGPHRVVDTLQAMLPPDARIAVDSGAHRILLSQRWRARTPLSLIQSAGWCTMGAALPLALGAGLAEPGRPVVAVVGDGGLEMTLGELGTLRDAGVPAVVVVLQDASLALIEAKARAAGLAPAGVALGRTDLAAVAAAFGGAGETVADADALARALRTALARDRFTVIAAAIEAADYDDAI